MKHHTQTQPKYRYMSATGKIPYNMTNDYIFRIVLQNNQVALKGLIGSLLHLRKKDIISVEILNPISPGQSVKDKEIRMDIRIMLNNHIIINLEMQMGNAGNWTSRSLTYMCREFDSLEHGDDYNSVQPVYQIAFLNFTLFENHPEFYATYRMKNIRDGYVYSDKLTLSVVELNSIALATDEDRRYGIDHWARLFKATTWEEMKMIAHGNIDLCSTAEAVFISNEDYNIRKAAREREEFRREQIFVRDLVEKQKRLLAEAWATIDEKTLRSMKKLRTRQPGC